MASFKDTTCQYVGHKGEIQLLVMDLEGSWDRTSVRTDGAKVAFAETPYGGLLLLGIASSLSSTRSRAQSLPAIGLRVFTSFCSGSGTKSVTLSGIVPRQSASLHAGAQV